MQTIVNPTINTNYSEVASDVTLWKKFTTYCATQEKNRLYWVGVILAAHGCILTPVTVMITLLLGPNFPLFMTAMSAMCAALVTNLAAMPTKITIPVFALSVLVDIGIIISCFSMAA